MVNKHNVDSHTYIQQRKTSLHNLFHSTNLKAQQQILPWEAGSYLICFTALLPPIKVKKKKILNMCLSYWNASSERPQVDWFSNQRRSLWFKLCKPISLAVRPAACLSWHQLLTEFFMHVVVLGGQEATCGPPLFAVCSEHCNGNVINDGMSFKPLFFLQASWCYHRLKSGVPS